jgi:hypothetical protein
MPKAEISQAPIANRAKKSSRFAVPADVAGRIGLLFLTLCALKLAMLVALRKHLFQVHWRISPSPPDWLNPVAFYLFAFLVGFSLWQLARRCAADGAGTVRAANTIALVIAACFIFLTFHAGDKNYIYPVMNGTLSWWDLRWYLNLNFFFQPPFLAVWIFVYALIYYGLARKKREHLILFVTAIFAAAYVAICLQDLMAFRRSLLSADAVGIAGLLASKNSGARANWFVVLQPWLWFAFFFFLFRSQDGLDISVRPELPVMCGWSIILFAGLGIFAWRRKLPSLWLWLWPFAFTSFFLLVNTNYDEANNYRNLMSLGLTLPRYFLGEFFIAFILLVAGTIYRKWLPKASLLWLDIINLIFIALALADLRLSQIMGIRLDWQAVRFGASAKMVWRLSKPYLPGIILGLIFISALYAVLIGLWKRETGSRTFHPGARGQYLLASFLLLGIIGIKSAPPDKAEGQTAILLAETSPLFTRTVNAPMDKATFIRTATQLGMQPILESIPAPTHAPRKLNVLLIFQESTYNKYLSLFDGTENDEPLLSQYTNRMEIFPNFFSDFAASMNARFATFTSLYPTRDVDAFTYHHVNVESLFDILHQRGYVNSVFYSSYFDYTGFRDFLRGRGIDAMYDADTMPGVTGEPPLSWGLREGQTLQAMLSQIQQYATNGQNFFLTYVPAAPHNPFDGTPREFKKNKIKVPGDFTPLYLNEVFYMDWVIASLIDKLKDTGLLDHTLVIITDDHGEMLGENGGPIGHGWTITPQLTDVPLIIMDPDNPGYHVNDTVCSQIDLLPTILDLLGIPIPSGQLYEGESIYSAAAQNDRTIYLNSFQQYGIVHDHEFIHGSRETENAGTNNLTAYAIVNDGAKTFFPKTNLPVAALPAINQFDSFQQNLIENYSYYCQLIK